MQKSNHRRAFLGKALITLLACLLMASGMMIGASAAAVFPKDATPPDVYLDGKAVLEDECIILNSITYVPLRNFCNLFEDCKITIPFEDHTASGRYDDMMQDFYAYIMGTKQNPFTYEHEYLVQRVLSEIVGGIRFHGKRID